MLRLEEEYERKHAFSAQCPRGAVQLRTGSAILPRHKVTEAT